MTVRKVWADFGPEYNPRHPANPNENCFTLAVDADDYGALEERLASIVAAAGKVTCWRCFNTGRDGQYADCPDCADLRALFNEVKP